MESVFFSILASILATSALIFIVINGVITIKFGRQPEVQFITVVVCVATGFVYLIAASLTGMIDIVLFVIYLIWMGCAFLTAIQR
jgi:hypothetical protein